MRAMLALVIGIKGPVYKRCTCIATRRSGDASATGCALVRAGLWGGGGGGNTVLTVIFLRVH